jgi:integrase/recombinase XerD
MLTYETLAEKFGQVLLLRNYAPRTVLMEQLYLKKLFRYLREAGLEDITKVRKETLRDYQEHLAEQENGRGAPLCVATQNNVLKAVKKFFRFLQEEDFLLGDPARSLVYAKTPRRLPRSIMTVAEVRKILQGPDTSTLLGYRDRAILELLYSTGIRKEEMASLLVADVDYLEGFVRVNHGKGGKDRVVPLGKIACRYLENYVKAVRPQLVQDTGNGFLFVSARGNRFSHNLLGELVAKYARRAKLNKNVTPHTFRHTCATLMLKNRANIRHIQELLGHSSLESTQVYTAVTVADLKAVHKRCHPREKETP